MKAAFRWVFPHPLLTLLLTLVWILLLNTTAPGMIVFGLILGLIIPWITSPWWPDTPSGFNPWRMFVYSLIVLWDIMVANVQVAWIVLTRSNASLRHTWIVVPLELRQPEAISMLAGTITLTPGTVSADLSDDGHCLLVHVLDTGDADGVRDEIKNRYERRLKEIFA